MLWTMYSATGGVMAALIVTTSKTGPFPAAAEDRRTEGTEDQHDRTHGLADSCSPAHKHISILSSLPPGIPIIVFPPEGLHDHLDILPDLLFCPGIPSR